MRLALAQMNAVVGGFAQNVETLVRFRAQAALVGADVVLTPELALVGYPPEDLLLKEGFIEASAQALLDLTKAEGLPPILVGTVMPEGAGGLTLAPASDGRDAMRAYEDEQRRSHVADVLVALGDEGVVATATKRLLPNYDVFDERRYFHPGVGPETIVNIGGVAVGLLVCEDVWTADGPAAALAREGATLIVVANASPYARGRREEREAMLRERALETNCPIAYVNLVGGQDELVFDGQSMAVDATGEVVARAGAFHEELLVCELKARDSSVGVVLGRRGSVEPHARTLHVNHLQEPLEEIEEIYEALVVGTRDYLRKNGFREAIVALSGGVDSSLVAAIAVDALGARAVRGFAMPSRYSSEGSVVDAFDLAERLDIEVTTLPIEAAHATFAESLAEALDGGPTGLTDENLQSRIRAVLMMAVSNATGAIVLTTGNKSEMAVGYTTLYGDSAGGFAVIKDVPKTLVYELCHYRNGRALSDGDPEPIPASVLAKAPSAELRAHQRDDQSLPPYDVLDALLELYVEEDATAEEIIALGYDRALVTKVTRLVDRSEYKRRQMPPGVRITKKAFGRDRRMPITNAFQPEA